MSASLLLIILIIINSATLNTGLFTRTRYISHGAVVTNGKPK